MDGNAPRMIRVARGCGLGRMHIGEECRDGRPESVSIDCL
jgi:hypothetical protein